MSENKEGVRSWLLLGGGWETWEKCGSMDELSHRIKAKEEL